MGLKEKSMGRMTQDLNIEYGILIQNLETIV